MRPCPNGVRSANNAPPPLRLWNKRKAEDKGEDAHGRITPECQGGTNRPNQQQEGDTDEQIGSPVAKGRDA